MSREHKPLATVNAGNTAASMHNHAADLSRSNMIRAEGDKTITSNSDTYRSGPTTLRSNAPIREVASCTIDYAKYE